MKFRFRGIIFHNFSGACSAVLFVMCLFENDHETFGSSGIFLFPPLCWIRAETGPGLVFETVNQAQAVSLGNHFLVLPSALGRTSVHGAVLVVALLRHSYAPHRYGPQGNYTTGHCNAEPFSPEFRDLPLQKMHEIL